jgi:hypothetical protein
MTVTVRTMAAGVAVLLGAAVLGGCGLRQTHLQDSGTVSDPIRSVRLDSGDGGVTLVGTPGATAATVTRAVTYSGNTAPTGTSYGVQGGVLTLSGCGRHCTVDYTVELPADLPVSGQVDNGEVRLTAVGEVQVRTDNGAVTLDGVRGPVDVQTSNGHVTGRHLDGGPVRARTDNGAVELTTTTPQDVTVGTGNGAVTVAVAAGRYVVDTRTDNGAEDVRVQNDPAGQHRVELTTDNGAITLSPS